MNYEVDIKIDEASLDVEWLNQPELAVKYGVHWAECFREVMRAEENVKITRAELVKEVSENWDELGYSKAPTGPQIESFYRNHKRHKEAKQELIDCQFELNVAEIAKKEISTTRKAALQNLVELHGQNYFAGPNVPRDLSREASQKESQKKADSGVRKRLKRKKS